jgi:lysozyme family protein
MANTKAAIDFVLKLEDVELSGDVTTNRGDTGGATRFGLAERWHPELVDSSYFDASKMDRDAALAIAQKTYDEQYCAPLMLAQIKAQSLAYQMLSFAINDGPVEAAKLIQRACCYLGKPVATDGKIGPLTVAAANALDAEQLLNTYSSCAKDFYRAIVHARPDQVVFLHGWLNRVDAVAKLAAIPRAPAAPAVVAKPILTAPTPTGGSKSE